MDNIKRQYNLPENFFLFIGQIYPAKNFGRLLQAYAKIGPQNSFYLVILGEHRWHCKSELELIKQLGISSWVIHLGWIKHDILHAIYKLSKAFLLPSLYESFGLPILEAMAAGCPVVTSNRYGTAEKDIRIFVSVPVLDHIRATFLIDTDWQKIK